MDLAAVMDDVAARLRSITGPQLRVHDHPPGTVTPPAAIVSYPEDITYDATGARGADRMTLPVVVVVGKAVDRAARDRLAAYASGSGARSIKAVLESGTYTAFHTIRVMGAEFDVVTIGGTDYVSALFLCDIFGSGG